MTMPKEQTVAAISRARDDLDLALQQLEHLPAFDLGTVGFAAHALNNYITVIDGTAQLLDAALQRRGDKDIQRWLEGLHHTSELMRHTVHQLINMSASDSAAFQMGEVDLPLLVERACLYYRRIALRKQIMIFFQNNAATPHVWSDRVAIAAALDNVLSNAVKYSPPGKPVRVEVKSEPGALVCSVRDEGPGITPADRPKLFQKGVRLSATPTGGEPSSGFGLAVAKDLVTKIGGEIWCETIEGPGACFCIWLPSAPKVVPRKNP